MSLIPDLPDRLIDAKERRLLVPFSDMHVWRLERDGKFPKRIKIGPNRVAWQLSEILAWIEAKADARD
jgi:prophage regulatory protein